MAKKKAVRDMDPVEPMDDEVKQEIDFDNLSDRVDELEKLNSELLQEVKKLASKESTLVSELDANALYKSTLTIALECLSKQRNLWKDYKKGHLNDFVNEVYVVANELAVKLVEKHS